MLVTNNGPFKSQTPKGCLSTGRVKVECQLVTDTHKLAILKVWLLDHGSVVKKGPAPCPIPLSRLFFSRTYE